MIAPPVTDMSNEHKRKHFLASSDDHAGKLRYKQGGLDADVSQFDGLVKISGKQTTSVDIDNDSSLSRDSNSAVCTQRSIKAYVDEHTHVIDDTTKLPLAGGTMTGNIDMDGSSVEGINRIYFNGHSRFINDMIDDDTFTSGVDAQAVASAESIKAYVDASTPQYILHIMNVGWYSTTGKIYLPLTGYTIEKTATTGNNEYISFVAPYDGELEKVVVRSENACGSSKVGFHKSATNTEVPNSTATEEITVAMGSDDTAYAFNFTGTSSFDAGDIIAISFDPTSSAYDTVATIIFKFDTTQGV